MLGKRKGLFDVIPAVFASPAIEYGGGEGRTLRLTRSINKIKTMAMR